MKPEFTPLRVTVIDLFAALLPGYSWLLLILTLANLLSDIPGQQAPSPFHLAVHLVQSASKETIPMFLLSLLCAMALGLAGWLLSRVEPTEFTAWLGLSLLLAVLFGIGYRKQRSREVATVYLNTLIVLHARHPTDKTSHRDG